MTDHLADADEIVAKAIQISSLEQRFAYLDQACGDDAELMSRVREMLDRVEPTAELQRSAVDSASATWHQAPDTDSVHDRTTGLVESEPLQVASPVLPQIPGYEVLEILGRGGMGVVYRARQLNLKRLVALKMIKGGDADEEGTSRFRAEAEAVARLQHPNIVQIYEVGDHAGQPYIAFEYIEGPTLSFYVERKPLSIRESAEIVESLARTMHFAHLKGVVHRDLKPGNVLMTELTATQPVDRHTTTGSSRRSKFQSLGHSSAGLVPKITDFGLAKQLDSDSELTRTGAVLGTPNYMAPEQASSERNIGPAADTYSLGTILYALLTQQPPFRGKNLVETMMMVRKDDPVPPRKLCPKVPRDLQTICLKCLRKEPAQRYASAEALADDLRRFLMGAPVQASPPGLLYRTQKLLTRNRGFALTAAAITMLLVAGVLFAILYRDASWRHGREVAQQADINLLSELRQSRPQLAALPFALRRAETDAWLQDADGLVDRLPTYVADLEQMRAEGTQIASGSPATTPQWVFSDPRRQLQYADLQQLVEGIVTLAARDGELSTTRDWSRRVPSVAENEQAWTKANTAIAAEMGIRVAAREGFSPLGRDPQSQLWEFADLRHGQLPLRDEAGRIRLDSEAGFIFVLIPGGEFLMGAAPDEPGYAESEYQHAVTLSPFMISKYEVTQSQWERIMGRNPSKTIGPAHPVDTISWLDAQQFCARTGLELPSEAQWEYACRAGTSGPFDDRDSPASLAWYEDNSGNSTHRVGEKEPNAFQLFDMHGNVLEWCQDIYDADFFTTSSASRLDPLNDSDDVTPQTKRVLRGGSYEGKAQYTRSGDRYTDHAEMRWQGFGLRPICPLE